VRKEQAARKESIGYDRHCRDLSSEEREKLASDLEAQGKKPVARFAMALEGESAVDDLIRGHVTWDNTLQGDFVILKSDGFPTYHLAVIVDDHHMGITHVMRAEEWLSSTPKHVQMHQALGYDLPQYAHLPMILGKDKSKLSKRHGATSTVEYRDMGFLPEAMVNFLALLGWSLDDQTQIISRDDLIKNFSIERIGKAGAIFDQEKLEWMNGAYIRELSPKRFVEEIRPFLERDLPSDIERPVDADRLLPIAPLLQERLKRLDEAADLTCYFFSDTIEYDPQTLVQRKMDVDSTANALRRSLDALKASESFDAESLEAVLRPLAEELGLKDPSSRRWR
jgi:glutamyl-tRNA synthetase